MDKQTHLSRQDVDRVVREAVSRFWQVRTNQATKQKSAGRSDQGARGAVTGGAQMDGFIEAIEGLAKRAGIPDAAVFTRSRYLELPGFFRPTKEWDLLIVKDGILLAAIETKSQVGPSFGNNFNNRTEEAMGSAFDLWTAFREEAYRHSIPPWLGYVFMLEDCPGSQKPVRVREPHFKVFPEFQDASYAKRYEIFCRKLVLERQYSATAFLMSKSSATLTGDYLEPSQEIGFYRFATSLVSHLQGFTA